MLSTLELLHYCQRFQDQLFAICFERSQDCAELLLDLRVLHAARIRQVLFCAADPGLVKQLKLWNRSGYRFLALEAVPEDLKTAAFIGRLQTELSAGRLPVVTLERFEPGDLEVLRGIMHCAVALGARKIFFPGEPGGLELAGKFRSYPTVAELEAALAQNVPCNLPKERLEFIVEQEKLHLVDIVLIKACRGAIYEEVFTHGGSGTLFTREYPNILRPANETDVRDIRALMQPYVDEGSLKPVSEEELLELAPSFMVYSVNDQIVAAAALLHHEDTYELGKLCTLPRYQARGRARDLVRAIQEKARQDGKRGLFALTVQDYVGEFFERLGFVPVEREQLPRSWREQYDFSRPSRAYWFALA